MQRRQQTSDEGCGKFFIRSLMSSSNLLFLRLLGYYDEVYVTYEVIQAKLEASMEPAKVARNIE